MAFQLPVEALGITLPNGYAAIVHVHFDRQQDDEHSSGAVHIYTYADKKARKNGKPALPDQELIHTYEFGEGEWNAIRTRPLLALFPEFGERTLRDARPDDFPADDPRGNIKVSELFPDLTLWSAVARWGYEVAEKALTEPVLDKEGKEVWEVKDGQRVQKKQSYFAKAKEV